MGTMRLFFNILLLVLFASCPARAGDALTPVNFKGLYVFTFSGIEFGRLGLDIAQDGNSTAMAADIKTTGLLSVFVKHSSHSTYEAKDGKGIYESNYHTRKKARYVKMLDANSHATDEILDPKDPPSKRPPVPQEMKKDALNPLLFVLKMRSNLMEIINKKESGYSLLFYDGRRLTQGDFTIEGKKTILYLGAKKNVVAVSVRRKLLAGFTPSELEEHDPKEPTVYLYYSDDARMLPLRIEVKYGIATIAATLTKECTKDESCLIGIKG